MDKGSHNCDTGYGREDSVLVIQETQNGFDAVIHGGAKEQHDFWDPSDGSETTTPTTPTMIAAASSSQTNGHDAKQTKDEPESELERHRRGDSIPYEPVHINEKADVHQNEEYMHCQTNLEEHAR